MPIFEIALAIVVALLGWWWFDSTKAHEAGIVEARAVCDAEGLQFLDETVALGSIRLVRNNEGRAAFRRVYDFEYSDTGDNRRKGSVVLIGHDVMVVNIGLRLVPPDRTLH